MLHSGASRRGGGHARYGPLWGREGKLKQVCSSAGAGAARLCSGCHSPHRCNAATPCDGFYRALVHRLLLRDGRVRGAVGCPRVGACASSSLSWLFTSAALNERVATLCATMHAADSCCVAPTSCRNRGVCHRADAVHGVVGVMRSRRSLGWRDGMSWRSGGDRHDVPISFHASKAVPDGPRGGLLGAGSYCSLSAVRDSRNAAAGVSMRRNPLYWSMLNCTPHTSMAAVDSRRQTGAEAQLGARPGPPLLPTAEFYRSCPKVVHIVVFAAVSSTAVMKDV